MEHRPPYRYQAQFADGHPCQISVCTNYADQAPIADKPILCSVAFGYRGGDNGLPNDADAAALEQLSEHIIRHADHHMSGIWVGSITAANKRIEFFYAEDADLFHQTNATFLNRLGKLAFPIGGNAEPDKTWQFYRDTLLPNREAQARERNQGTIDAMLAYGDDLESLRPIHHYVYFDSLEQAQAFADAAADVQAGHFLSDIVQSADHTEVYRVKLTHVGRIRADEMAKTAAQLEALAERFHGQYDDWEAILAKQP